MDVWSESLNIRASPLTPLERGRKARRGNGCLNGDGGIASERDVRNATGGGSYMNEICGHPTGEGVYMMKKRT